MMTTDVLTEIASAVASAATLLQTADNNIQKWNLWSERKPENKRLVDVYRGSIARLAGPALAHIVDDAPARYKLLLVVDLHVERLVSSVALEDDLRNVFTIRGDLSHHKHLAFTVAKVVSRKLHLEREAGVVH